MAKYFNGFDGFDYRKDVWGEKKQTLEGTETIHSGIFTSFEHGYSIKLKKRLLIKPDCDATSFSLKLDGERPWNHELNSFLAYPADQYKIIWCDFRLDLGEKKRRNAQIDLNKSLAVFVKFIRSVPESASDLAQCRFLPAAKEICKYLQAILDHCGVPSAEDIPECTGAWSSSAAPSLPNDAKEWIAAGLYAIVALVLQNGSDNDILFYRPPQKHDPVTRELKKSANTDNNYTKSSDAPNVSKEETAPTVLPEAPLYSPEPELPFDFFAHIKSQLAEMQSPNNLLSHDAKGRNAQTTAFITPSAVRQQKTTILCSFELTEFPGFNSHAFIIEKCVKQVGNVWHPRIKLRKLVRSTRNVGGMAIHTFLLQQEQMSPDDICEGIIISTETNGTRCRLYSFDLTSSEKWNKFDSVSIRPSSWKFVTVDIDKDGYLADRNTEDMLDFYDIQPLESKCRPLIPERTSIPRKMEPDFWDYRVLDWNTQKEIPKYSVRNQITGEQQIAITVPCPGQLIVLEMDSFSLSGDLLAVFGNLYGLYGCKQDELEANIIMMKGAFRDSDPQMAFQYGAYLKCKEDTQTAESYLRMAAQEGISGAQFELAELLKARGTPKDISEAKQLIDELWQKGYRTYGTSQSIDLLDEHQSSDQPTV